MTIKNTLTTIGETGYNLIGKMHKSGKASMLSTTRVCEFFFDPKRGNRPSPLYFVDPTKEYSLIDVDSWIELKDNTARKILTKPSLELYNLKPVGNKKDGTPNKQVTGLTKKQSATRRSAQMAVGSHVKDITLAMTKRMPDGWIDPRVKVTPTKEQAINKINNLESFIADNLGDLGEYKQLCNKLLALVKKVK
jgi:hypothetical protein|tara:strand:+ start:104 stop:682 length:579 start_codon:yes stop_codon:yes gene_type:complete